MKSVFIAFERFWCCLGCLPAFFESVLQELRILGCLRCLVSLLEVLVFEVHLEVLDYSGVSPFQLVLACFSLF